MGSFLGGSPAPCPVNKCGARMIRLTDVEGNESHTKTSENTTVHIYGDNQSKLGEH